MNFYSTNDTSLRVDLKTAVLESLPKDRGLYMPEEILPLSEDFWKRFPGMSFNEMAFEVSRQLLRGSLPDEELREICRETINFDAPLRPLEGCIKVLELFHGPTLAFKDFGARFMAQLMSLLNRGESLPLSILVATSGDTGGAVAAGFFKTPHVRVCILYPKGRVSPLQEKQLTTLGENITALEVEGAFDDCQAMVKEAFLDEELNAALRLTSANSINIARLIPQTFYYFRGMQQLWNTPENKVFCVPSGNFGNLSAGLIARKLGLPIHRMIAATNANEVVPAYLKSGNFEPRLSLPTLSNAMDVGNPSNFYRMLDLYQGKWERVRKEIHGYSYDDEGTLAAMKKIYDKEGYVLDPHTAVGYLAAKEYLNSHPEEEVVVLGTAHPAKFSEAVSKALGREAEVPERLARLAHLTKEAREMPAEFSALKEFLLEEFT